MKLDKHQIQALAAAVRQKREREAKKFNAALKADKKVIAEAKRIVATVNKLPENIKVHLRDSYGRSKTILTVNSVIDRLVRPKMKEEHCYNSTIEQQIIIATIDANDLAELKRKIGLDI